MFSRCAYRFCEIYLAIFLLRRTILDKDSLEGSFSPATIEIKLVESIYIKDKICMYVCPHISSEITEPNSTKLPMPPRSYHGTLNKKYLTDRSIFAKDMLIF